MAYTTTPNTDFWQYKLRGAKLEQNRELVRQNVRDSKLDQLSKAMIQAFVDRTDTLDGLKALCKSYRLDINEKEWKMDKAQELNLLKDQAKALARRIEKLEFGRWGKEPANGAMFKIEKRFSSTGENYTYLALKAAGIWTLTGAGYNGSKTYDWDGLKDFAGKYSRVWRLTVAEELLD